MPQDLGIADQFALRAQSPHGQPDEWVEPVEGLQQDEQPIQRNVPALHVNQFMENDQAQFLVAQVLQHHFGKQNARPKSSKHRRSMERIAFHNRNLLSQSDLTFGVLDYLVQSKRDEGFLAP